MCSDNDKVSVYRTLTGNVYPEDEQMTGRGSSDSVCNIFITNEDPWDALTKHDLKIDKN